MEKGYDIFKEIRDEKDHFFALGDNSDKYFESIKEFMRFKGNFDLSLYRNNYLKGRIFHRIKTKHYGTFKAYLMILKSNLTELHLLKALLTIHTTEFFRDLTPFHYLEKKLFRIIAKNHKSSNIPIRILSAPCSTGQEVYSIAIIIHRLKSMGVIRSPVEIHGIDIDDPSIQSARAGIYPKELITNISESDINKYFDNLDDGNFQIKKEIRSLCQFQIHDIFTPLPFNFKFDLLVCRNLLIYISKERQKIIYNILKKVAFQNSFLMLGNTEGTNLLRDKNFKIKSLDNHIYQYIGSELNKLRTVQSETSDSQIWYKPKTHSTQIEIKTRKSQQNTDAQLQLKDIESRTEIGRKIQILSSEQPTGGEPTKEIDVVDGAKIPLKILPTKSKNQVQVKFVSSEKVISQRNLRRSQKREKIQSSSKEDPRNQIHQDDIERGFHVLDQKAKEQSDYIAKLVEEAKIKQKSKRTSKSTRRKKKSMKKGKKKPQKTSLQEEKDSKISSIDEYIKEREKAKDTDMNYIIQQSKQGKKPQKKHPDHYEILINQFIKKKIRLANIMIDSQEIEQILFEDTSLDSMEIRLLERKLEKLKEEEWDISLEIKTIQQDIHEIEQMKQKRK